MLTINGKYATAMSLWICALCMMICCCSALATPGQRAALPSSGKQAVSQRCLSSEKGAAKTCCRTTAMYAFACQCSLHCLQHTVSTDMQKTYSEVQLLHDIVARCATVCHRLSVHQLPHIRLYSQHIIGVVLQTKPKSLTQPRQHLIWLVSPNCSLSPLSCPHNAVPIMHPKKH